MLHSDEHMLQCPCQFQATISALGTSASFEQCQDDPHVQAAKLVDGVMTELPHVRQI